MSTQAYACQQLEWHSFQPCPGAQPGLGTSEGVCRGLQREGGKELRAYMGSKDGATNRAQSDVRRNWTEKKEAMMGNAHRTSASSTNSLHHKAQDKGCTTGTNTAPTH
eukprot:scaffold98874_cov19-Tisochrysis_lutea.AAC.2